MQGRETRRLAAVMALDIVGYSRLVAEDEDGSVGRWREDRDGRVKPAIESHGGRTFKTTGDGLLAEFPSVVEAVRCAVRLQTPPETGAPGPFVFRIGVHLGDVLADGDDILGDGVNIAARLEGIAPPGGVCLSRAAWEQVQGKTAAKARPLGSKFLKNIPQAIDVWEISHDPGVQEDQAAEHSPRIRLDLLGGFRLSVDGEPAALSSAKARLLLSRLVLASAGEVPREALAGLLWEEAGEEQARGSLRQALVQVRHALGAASDALTTDAERVRLDPRSVATDLRDLADADAEALPAMLAEGRFEGELLAGVAARGREIEDWLAIERERARARVLDGLAAAAAAAENAGDLAAAVELTRRELVIEPLREPAHRRLMSLLAARGDASEALRRFDALRDLLRRELGTEPEQASVELAAEIRARRRASPETGATPAAEPAPPEEADVRITSALREIVMVCALAAGDDPEEQAAEAEALSRAGETLAREHGAAVVPSVEADAVLAFGAGAADEADFDHARALADAIVSAQPRARVGISSGRALVEPGPPLKIVGEAGRAALAAAASAAPGSVAVSPLAPAVARPKPPFVGRATERRQLAALLEVASGESSGALVLLSGEAGIGKSRLAEECAEAFVEMGGRVARAGFSGFGEEREPFGRRLTRSLLETGIDPAQPPAELAPAVLAARAHLLGAPPPPGGKALLAAMDEDRRADAAADAIAGLIAQAAQPAGLLVVLEDAHWANRGELARIRRLADRVADLPVVLIVTERPADARLAPMLRRQPPDAELLLLELSPLPARDARRLASVMGRDDVAFVEQALGRAGGNALFLVRLLEAGPELAGAPPPSVVSLVQAQTDALPADERDRLRRAAVLGQRFSPEDFAAVFGPADFRGLAAAGFLARDGERLAFAHALLHEAVYSSITRADRRRLHARAAERFAGDHPVLRADHALLAGAEDASDICAEAAEALLSRYEFARAERYIEAGLAAPGESGEGRGRLLLCRGTMRRERGELDDAVADYAAAVEAAETDDLKAMNLVRAAWALRLRGDLDRADAQLDAVEALGLDVLSAERVSEYWSQRGNQAFARGRVEACVKAHDTAAGLATGALQRARALSGLGDAQYAAGRMRSAARSFAECLRLAREGGYGMVEMANIFMEPICLRYSEPSPAVFALMDEAVERARQAGAARAQLIGLAGRAELHLAAGRVDEAEADARRMREISRTLGGTRFDTEIDYIFANIANACGRREEALGILEQAISRLTDTDRGYIGPVLLGLAARTSPDPAAARRRIAKGEAMLAGGAVGHCHFWFRAHAINAALEHGLRGVAEAQADALEAYAADEPLPWVDLVTRRARLLARLHAGAAAEGDAAEAAALADALDAADMGGFAPELREAARRI